MQALLYRLECLRTPVTHSGRSRKRSSESRLLSLFFYAFEILVNRSSFLVPGLSLRSAAGLEEVLDKFCDVDVEDELVLTTGPLLRVSVFFAEFSK